MLRIRLRELIHEKELREGRDVKLGEIREETGISTQVLSNLRSLERIAVTNTANIDALWRFFQCPIQDLFAPTPELGEEESCHVDDLFPDRRS